MKLKVKDINLSTGGPLIAVLHENTAKKLNIYPSDRAKLKRLRLDKEINCVIDTTTKGISENEIGLFEDVLKKLNISENAIIDVELAERPISIQYIKKKLEGIELKTEEIYSITEAIINNELSEAELTYFISGCFSNGLTLKETVDLTNAIVNTGDQLKFKDKIIVDKHCIGGVPGNRTTMIVVPIIASLGYKMPKTSSRAITSAAGTADTMEVLAPVNLSKSKLLKVVNKTNACITWGGAINLASADDKLIKIRHPLSIDPECMLLASIMAKKKAANATHVLIDIPFGKWSKISTKIEAKKLKKLFLKIGKELDIKTRVVLTDGSSPIGNGIGPALEAQDVISVLEGDGPTSLRNKSIFLATEILKLINIKDPKNKATQAIDSGTALNKFIEIVQEQGGNKNLTIPKPKYFYNVKATRKGKVKSINNKIVSRIARLAGAPEDKTAGIFIRVRKYSKILKGSELYTVYSNSKQNIEILKKRLKELDPINY